MSPDPRHTYRYQVLRKNWMRTAGNVCTLCGQPIDRTLPGTHRRGATIEHTVNVADRPDLAFVTALWRVAHNECNQRKGAAEGGRRKARRRRKVEGVRPVKYSPSRDW